MKPVLFLGVALLSVLAGIGMSARAQGHDMAYDKKITFTVEKKNDAFRVSSEVQVKAVYLNARILDNRVYYIPEQYYNSISRIKGTFHGYDLKREAINFSFPKSEDAFISDYKIHSIVFPPELKVQDSIQYSWQENFLGPEYMPIETVPNIDYVRNFQITINHPKDVRVEWEMFFPREPVPYSVDSSSATRMVITFSNLPKQETLTFFPFTKTHAAILFKLFEKGKALNPVKVTDFAMWYWNLINRYGLTDERQDSLVQALTAGKTEPTEKLRAIHDFVKTNIRYIGDFDSIHTIVPHRSSAVLQRRYGDCKDRALLVMNMARSAGLNVYMALLSTEPEYIFTSGTHRTLFNHMIYAFREGDSYRFFDPTQKYCEFGNLPQSDIGQLALVIDTAKPVLMTVGDPNVLPALDIQIKAGIGEPRSGQALIILRNDYFSAALKAKSNLKNVELENFVSKVTTSYLNKIALDSFRLQNVSDSAMTLTARADIHEFMITSTTKKYIPQTAFVPLDGTILQREKDAFAIHLPFTQHFRLTLDLETPGYHVNAPKTLDFGMKELWFFRNGFDNRSPDRITITYEFMNAVKLLEGTERTAFIDFCKAYLKNKTTMFTLTRDE